jgi:hypothetical protein
MTSTLPHLRSIVDHDGGVILDIPQNTISTLNSTGAYVWERLERGMAIDAIVSELALETGTDPAIVHRDVEIFLDDLKSKHLFA